MKKLLKIIVVLFLISIYSNIFAQDKIVVEGNVYELNKAGKELGIPGVNVYWVGTQEGTSTDINGHFKLAFPNTQPYNLVVSFIGFKKDTLMVSPDQKSLKILLSSNQELDEVVIAERALGSHINRMNPILTQKNYDRRIAESSLL